MTGDEKGKGLQVYRIHKAIYIYMHNRFISAESESYMNTPNFPPHFRFWPQIVWNSVIQSFATASGHVRVAPFGKILLAANICKCVYVFSRSIDSYFLACIYFSYAWSWVKYWTHIAQTKHFFHPGTESDFRSLRIFIITAKNRISTNHSRVQWSKKKSYLRNRFITKVSIFCKYSKRWLHSWCIFLFRKGQKSVATCEHYTWQGQTVETV